VNQKAGVGKTTTSINLERPLAAVEAVRVLIVILIAQGKCLDGLGYFPGKTVLHGAIDTRGRPGPIGRGRSVDDVPRPDYFISG